jgi:Leucine-rich repeat (LRR) protein
VVLRAEALFQSLRNLHLDGNNFTKLEKKAFGRLPVVFVLGLSHNQLWNISTQAFEGLLQLINLDLSSNNLTYIPPGAFQVMSSEYLSK